MNQTKPNRENKVHDLKTQTYASDTYTIHHSEFDTKWLDSCKYNMYYDKMWQHNRWDIIPAYYQHNTN